MEFMEINAKNTYTSLLCIADFIRFRKVNTGVINKIQKLKGFGDATFNFISSIYKANWNTIYSDKRIIVLLEAELQTSLSLRSKNLQSC